MQNSTTGSSTWPFDKASNVTPLKVAGGLALATGSLVIGYATYKYFQSRHTYDKAREEKLNKWLSNRLLKLQNALGINDSQRRWLHDELDTVAELAHRACRKLGFISPTVLDRLTIEIERQYVKVKRRVHKILKLVKDTHIRALHDFYEEFREKFFGVHLNEDDYATSEDSSSRNGTAEPQAS